MSIWAQSKGRDTFGRTSNGDARYTPDAMSVSPRGASTVSRTGSLIALALASEMGLAAQASDHARLVTPYTMTPERMVASLAALAALSGAVIGALALARAAGRVGTGNGRRAAIVALVLGPIGLVVGGLVVVAADGGLGTGNGLGGGVAAMVLGLIGVSVGGMALVRGRRTA